MNQALLKTSDQQTVIQNITIKNAISRESVR